MERERAYVYGNTARVLEMPERSYEGQRKVSPNEQPRIRKKKKIDKVSLLLVVLSFVAVMGASVFYLHLKFQATYLSKSVVELQGEVVDLEKDNATLNMELENSVDLNQVYNRATKELGMSVAKDSQVYSYESKRSTQIRQHGAIPSSN